MMKKMQLKKMAWLCVIAMVVTAGTSQAGVTVNYDNVTSPQEATTITSNAYGDTMDGMSITYSKFGGGSEILSWSDGVGIQAGGVAGSSYLWSLDQLGNTNVQPWYLSVDAANPMASLLIDAGAGNTVFDVLPTLQYTAGSDVGLEFASSDEDDWTVKYYGPVSKTGEAFQGDLYRYLLITPNLGSWSGEMTFQADTDKVASITPVVPVPGALLLAGLGSGVVSFFRRRQWV